MATTEAERTQETGEAYELRREVAAAAEERASIIIRDPFWFTSLVVSGATAASLLGIGTLVLSIFGLSGVLATHLAPVAGIVAGAAFLTLAGVDAAWGRMFRFLEHEKHETRRDRIAVSSSTGAVLLAGIATIILGILNLVFLANPRFMGIAVLAMGIGLLWHSGLMRQVRRFTNYVTYHGVEERRPGGPMAINALSLAPVRDLLLGVGSAVLGILAIVGVASVALELVALLVLGGALTLTVSTICGATLTTLKGVREKR